jgi:protein PhnA
MTVENILNERSGSQCELCTSKDELIIYDVKPNAGPSADSSLLVCEKCHGQIKDPSAIEVKHWYCLNDSMWSEYAPVQVMAYRVLKTIGNDSWATDLVGQLYLDEDNQKWADAGLPDSANDSAPTLDSNGTKLTKGDTITLIKDLVVKGANFTAKRGTTVKNISLTDDPKLIEGRVNGTHIVLVAAYLKKA